MKKKLPLLLKIGAGALGLLLAAAALAPVLLKKYLPPEKVRELIAANARKSLGREVRLGDVSYSLLKGLSVRELAVSEAPDFKAGIFAQAASLNVRPQWLPLLHKKIVLDAVSAEGLKVSVTQLKPGVYNFSDIGASAPAAGAAAAGAGAAASAFELRARVASVSGGELRYKDAVSGDQWTLSGLDARVSHFRLSGPFEAEVSVRIDGKSGGKPVAGAFAYKGRLDLGGQDPKKFAAEFKKLTAESRGLTISASGKLEGLTEPKIAASFSLSGASGALLDGKFDGAVNPAAKTAAGALDARTPGFSSDVLAAFGAPKGVAVPAGSASGKFEYGGDRIVLHAFKVESRGGGVWLDGAASGLSTKPAADLDFSAKLDVPAFKASDVPWAKLPEGLSAPAFALESKGHVKGDDVRLDSFHLKAQAGTVDASGAVHALTGKPQADLELAAALELPELKAADYPWAKLPAGYASPAMQVDGKLHVKGEDVTIAALHVKSKAGTADVSGAIRRVFSGPLDPDLNVQAKLSLPALKSADIPFSSFPPDLQLPASSWDTDLSASLDQVKIRKLRLIVGKNDVEIADAKIASLRSGAPLFSVLVKCRSFDLGQLTQFSPATREEDLSGTGYFAVEVTGKWPKPILAGKLLFKELGATVSGLKLSEFTGTASFDERRIDIPKLHGKVADGNLDMDLTVKDYTTAPKLDLEAQLDQFDLGKFLAAKTQMAQKAAAKGAPASESKPAPIDASGKLAVGKLLHPNATANDLRLNWDLTGITPELVKLDGTANFKIAGGGKFTKLGDMATQSKLLKVLIFPLMVFQKVGSIGGIRLFPDFNNVTFSDIGGDYAFASGNMTLKDSHIVSDVGSGTAQGSIDLPAEKLDLLLTAKVANLAPMDVEVKGTFDKPSSRLKLGKFLADPIKNLFKRPGEEAAAPAAQNVPGGQ